MKITIAQAINRSESNGLSLNKAYYLLLRFAQTGEAGVFIYEKDRVEKGQEIREIIYDDSHSFLKEWQDITAFGWANNEKDLFDLFIEILSENKK